MIYEMLTGARPFQGDNAQAILYSILTQPPRPVGELRADVRPEMGRLLDSVLQKERTARPDSIVEHLQRLQAGGGIPESDRRQARVPVIAVLPSPT